MLKRNNLRFGILIGFFAPLLSLVLYYFIKFYPLFTVSDFFEFLSTNKNQITAISVPCLLLNIGLFTYYINSKIDETAKGIFAITLFYAITALVLKYII